MKKQHTFLQIYEGNEIEGKTRWKCVNCTAEFLFSGDARFERKFEAAWKGVGIDEDCDIEIVKRAITS